MGEGPGAIRAVRRRRRMTSLWTTSRPPGWPANGFQSRLGAIVLGLAATMVVWIIQVQYVWDAVERHYLTSYILASTGWFEKYTVLETIDGHGQSHLTIAGE